MQEAREHHRNPARREDGAGICLTEGAGACVLAIVVRTCRILLWPVSFGEHEHGKARTGHSLNDCPKIQLVKNIFTTFPTATTNSRQSS